MCTLATLLRVSISFSASGFLVSAPTQSFFDVYGVLHQLRRLGFGFRKVFGFAPTRLLGLGFAPATSLLGFWFPKPPTPHSCRVSHPPDPLNLVGFATTHSVPF